LVTWCRMELEVKPDTPIGSVFYLVVGVETVIAPEEIQQNRYLSVGYEVRHVLVTWCRMELEVKPDTPNGSIFLFQLQRCCSYMVVS
jgi:hypothetical protein